MIDKVIRRQDQIENLQNNTKDLADYTSEFNRQKQPEPDTPPTPTTPPSLTAPSTVKRKKSLAELLQSLFPQSSQSEYNSHDFL